MDLLGDTLFYLIDRSSTELLSSPSRVMPRCPVLERRLISASWPSFTVPGTKPCGFVLKAGVVVGQDLFLICVEETWSAINSLE